MLEWIELFEGLSPEEIKTLEMFSQFRLYEKWEIIFQQWQEATAMYILKSGSLEAYTHDRILGQILPGNFFGEMAIFTNHKTRTASVRVLENAEVIIFLSFSINELWNKHPEIFEKIKIVINKRIKENESK